MQLFHSYSILSNSTLKKYMDHKSEIQNVEYSILCLQKLPLELVGRHSPVENAHLHGIFENIPFTQITETAK